MKILFLTKYSIEGASSRYRFYNYLSYFEEAGIVCDFKPLLGNNYVSNLYNDKKLRIVLISFFSVFKRFIFLLFNSKKYNLLIIEKELFPNIPYFIEAFLLKGYSYALDFDDYIATSYKTNRYKKLFLRDKVNKLSQKAKLVTVGNHWYFEEIKSNNLIYLPSVINFENYSKIKSNYDSDIISIVWIGSPSTVHYLHNLIPTLQMLSKNYRIKLKVIGAFIKAEGLDINIVEWNAKTEAKELLSSDIGIMPLESTMWEKGKCGFKLIQYMASGLPVVANSSPANDEIIQNNLNGFIINDNNNWYIKLEELILNKSLRESFGKSGRFRIESEYSYQVWGSRYLNIIKNA